MRICKGVYDREGNIDLAPVSLEEVQQSGNAFFYLGGNISTWRQRRSIEGILHILEHVLGKDAATVDAFIVAYNNARKNWRETATINQDASHTNPEAEEFVDKYLLPMLEQGKTHITLFGYSYGTAFAEMVRRTLIVRMEEKHVPEEEIRRKLQSILLVSLSGAANTMDEAHSATAPLEYSAIMIDSQNDQGLASRKVPALQARQRILEERKLNEQITITPLSGNRVEVTIPVAPLLDPIKRWNKEERKMELRQPAHPKELPPAHQIAYYTWPNKAIHPDGRDFFSEALRYAVNRPQAIPGDMLDKVLEIKNRLLSVKQEQDTENGWAVYTRTPGAAAIER